MAVKGTAIRPLTADEKKTMVEVGTSTPKQAIIKKLKAKEVEYTKKHLPFSYAAAKIDIDDAFDDMEKEFIRGGVEADKIVDNMIKKFNFDDYGNKSRFVLINVKESNEDKLLDGIRTSVLTNYIECYYDKHRPNLKMSVFVPKEIYEKRNPKKPETEE